MDLSTALLFGVTKINNKETLNAKSRFGEEAGAIIELEKREYIKDKFLSPKPKQ